MRVFKGAGLVGLGVALGVALAALGTSGTRTPGQAVTTVSAPERGGPPEGLTNHPPPGFRCCADTEPVNGKGGSAISGAYEIVREWPVLPHPDYVFGTVAGFAIEGDRILAATRGERRPPKSIGWGRESFDVLAERTGPETLKDHMLIAIDRNTGKITENWSQWNDVLTSSQRLLISPYDPKKEVWVSGSGAIMRFSNDGKQMIQKITNADVPKTPNTSDFFPEGMAWLPNGDVWVISSSRIIKFNKDGKYVTEFGTLGSDPGQFKGAHDIVADVGRNRMYIADRQNSRLVVTDLAGRFLDQWPNIVSPYSLGLTRDGRYLWVGDGWIQRMQKYDAATGKLLYTFGTFGNVPGTFWGLHYFTTDVDGNFYLGEDYGGRIQKWRPKKDADPSQLIGPLMWGPVTTSSR